MWNIKAELELSLNKWNWAYNLCLFGFSEIIGSWESVVYDPFVSGLFSCVLLNQIAYSQLLIT